MGTVAQDVTPRQKVENVNEINTYLKSTVSKVGRQQSERSGNHRRSSEHSVTEDATVCSASFKRN